MEFRIAFVSQGGNVMKTTLATAMAALIIKENETCTIIDLDEEHLTATKMAETRENYGITAYDDFPSLSVKPVNSVSEALNYDDDEFIVILDLPSRAPTAIVEVAKNVDILVIPTMSSAKDIELNVQTINSLVLEHGIAPEKVFFVITRATTEVEFRNTIAKFNDSNESGENYKFYISPNPIYEKRGYRRALEDGYCVNETEYDTLNVAINNVIQDIIDHAAKVKEGTV